MARQVSVLVMLGLMLHVGSTVRAEDAGQAQAIIDKALQAQGGESKLQENQAATWKGKGKFYGMGTGMPYTVEYAVQWPDESRTKIDAQSGEDQKFDILTVYDRTKGWMQMNGGDAQEMNEDQLAEQKEELHAAWISHLIPLKQHKDQFTLSALGDSKVGEVKDGKFNANEGPAVAGVKVASKGYRDVELYFDKDTGLLAKMKRKVKDPQSGEEKTQINLFSDYQDVDGVKMATKVKVVRDEDLYVEQTISDMKLQPKLDPKLFAEPSSK